MIYASEVIEHVANRPTFIAAIAGMLKPDGVVVIPLSIVACPILAKITLEYVVRIVPPGTHDQLNVRPDELRAEFAAAFCLKIWWVLPRPGGGFMTSARGQLRGKWRLCQVGANQPTLTPPTSQ